MQGGSLYLVDGIGGVADKSVVLVSGVVEGTGPLTYLTVLGDERTVMSFRRHEGHLPWRPVIMDESPDLTNLPPLPQPKKK